MRDPGPKQTIKTEKPKQDVPVENTEADLWPAHEYVCTRVCAREHTHARTHENTIREGGREGGRKRGIFLDIKKITI